MTNILDGLTATQARFITAVARIVRSSEAFALYHSYHAQEPATTAPKQQTHSTSQDQIRR